MKVKLSFLTSWFAVFIAMFILTCISTQAQTIWYVDASASSNGNGEAWGTALNNLDDALDIAGQGDQIWVAQGTYKPSVGTGRAKTFTLKNGVRIYGGFAGHETALYQRQPDIHVTILSGEIGSSPPGDNAYHVVTGEDLGPSTILSGFTITGGNADATSGVNSEGGGAWLVDFDGAITRCRFVSNNASLHGGGLHIIGGAGRILNCTFKENSAVRGAGAFLENGQFHVVNSVFAKNSAGVGAGIALSGTGVKIVNCTIADNHASLDGAGIWIYGTHIDTIVNTIVWGNTADQASTEEAQITLYQEPHDPVVKFSNIEGCDHFCEEPLDGNIDDDPLFCGDYRLDENSPCIDVGDNASVIWEDDHDILVDVDDDGDLEEPIADRDLNVRIVDAGGGAVVDMGAFEWGPCPEADLNGDCIVDEHDLNIVLAN